MFKGSMVALITPMHKNGTIDKKALHDLIEWHLHAKTDAIVVVGTTGESATLEPYEQSELISLVVQQVAKKIPVIAGTGSNSTKLTLRLTEQAKKVGVDACLIVTPYYNKPTQNGLYQHYKMIAETVDVPLILYNVPGRTACDMLPETIERLSQFKNIIGVKEATGNIERTEKILQNCDKKIQVYSGDDMTALDLMLHGAVGVISVTANVAPEKMHELCAAALSGNVALAKKINDDLMLLHKCLFLESNPIPTKWALYMMGKIDTGIRLPLLPLDEKYQEDLKLAMQQAGVKV
ncbi:MAG: 4-hydroxy-tetrahydrodipicolinate synthase [Gammaproteobacteria bacterium RIFCSPHIGHO2_12_FULL_37_14]|nr:MAG: 4-hydroxy-tetrahydrodipicolinate synthase [Gammaproteobacteria bacterium RIFCSPHIGHO2_12_FULL_37_14]